MAERENPEYVVELRGITKYFPGVVALKNMQLQIKPGEIHGLIGENGAGKSTLIKTLTGVYKPEEGQIFVDGAEQHFHGPNDARTAGIACVYQELNIIKLLSVTDNVFLGHQMKGAGGLLDYPRMHKEAAEALAILGQNIDPQKNAGELGVGQQQMIEIAKAVRLKAKLIIMDEPTSSLGEHGVKQLMEVVRKLKSQGVAILFVSHKLEELFELCDRVTVIRDGEHVKTQDIGDWTSDSLIQAMVGRTLDNLFPKVSGTKGECYLEVKNLMEKGAFSNVSFKAYGGQVLGFAGLVGAGRTEVMRAIFGADKPDGGEISIRGKKMKLRSPKQAIAAGLAFITEDRKGQGLILDQTIRNNFILATMNKFIKNGFLDEERIESTGQSHISSLKIKTPSIDEVVGKLSGGNQQKVVIGKWVNAEADIYIFDEPTRGIDVGAKIEVYNVINKLVEEGKCVIMVSSELPEILGMCDRVIVMREGKIMGEIERESEQFNSESIMKAAWGGKIA